MDFLGLRNLTIIDDASSNIERQPRRDVDLETLPLDDKPTYELLARGDTLGVFQLDGGPMRALLRLDGARQLRGHLGRPRALPARARWAPTRTTTTPTARTAASRSRRSTPSWREPLADILGDTYGLIVYQEQVMAIAQKLAGYSLGKADLLRRAMGKKKKEILDKEFVPFAAGMRDQRLLRRGDQDAVGRPGPVLRTTRSTRRTPPATAWSPTGPRYLKANYPAEYMAALLTCVGDDKDKIGALPGRVPADGHQGAAAGRQRVRRPTSPRSAPTSASAWRAVRNVGHNVVDVDRARPAQEKGAYTDFYDFLRKVDAGRLQQADHRVADQGRRVRLARAHPRAACSTCTTEAIDAVTDVKRNEAIGQFDLFGAPATPAAEHRCVGLRPSTPTASGTSDMLAFEREMLGLYVSDHPLVGLEHVLRKPADITIASLLDEEDGPDGADRHARRHPLRRAAAGHQAGQAWASPPWRTWRGIEALFFPNTYEIIGMYIAEGLVVAVRGRTNRRESSVSVVGMDLMVLDISSVQPDTGAPVVVVVLESDRLTNELALEFRRILHSHQGNSPLQLRLRPRPAPACSPWTTRSIRPRASSARSRVCSGAPASSPDPAVHVFGGRSGAAARVGVGLATQRRHRLS